MEKQEVICQLLRLSRGKSLLKLREHKHKNLHISGTSALYKCFFYHRCPQTVSHMPDPVHAITKLGAEPKSALNTRAGLQERTGINKRMKILSSCPVLSL